MLFRTAAVIVVLFIGLSIPHFSKLLNLLGGSTIACLSFIFPPLFYMKLKRDEFNDERRQRVDRSVDRNFNISEVQVVEGDRYEAHIIAAREDSHVGLFDDDGERESYIGWPMFIVNLLIAAVGLVGGAVCTYSAVADIVDPNAFTPPCYLNFRYNCHGEL